MSYKQGDIVFTNLDPVRGHEQAGDRPCLIISNDDYNPVFDSYITQQ